jgi:hypothetical protein
MKFKAKFALLKRNTVTREIGGQTFTFYPISVPMLFELRSTMEPLMQGLKALFAKHENDGTQTVEETKDPNCFDPTNPNANIVSRVTHLGSVPVETVKFRAEQSDVATKAAIEAVLGEQNRMLLGRVLADSLRDEGIRTDAEIAEFIKDPALDLPLLVELLSGFFAVNAKVFGPFADRVRSLVKEKVAHLTPNDPAADSVPASQSTEPGS